MENPNIDTECPPFDTDAWKTLADLEKERCKKIRLPVNTSKFLVFNSLNMVVIAVIGGFVFALALIIIDALQAQLPNVSLYWFALILFGIVIIFTVIQYYTEKQKNFYQQQIQTEK